MGKSDVIVGGVFLAAGAVLLVLAIVVPIILAVTDEGDPCPGAGYSLKPGEQMMCVPDDYFETWTSDFDRNGLGYVKAYRDSLLSLGTTTRYNNYHGSYHLHKRFEAINFSVSYRTTITITTSCPTTYGTLKTYLLTRKQFNDARDEYGTFYEGEASYEYLGCGSFARTMVGPDYFYLVFSSSSESSVDLAYDIDLSYTVYRPSANKDSCETEECDFGYIILGDVILLDYDNTNGYGPDVVNARIHNNDRNWSSILGAFFGLFIVSLVCFALAAVFLKKIAKKIGKAGNKALGGSGGVAAAPVAAAPVAAAPVAAQPYPAQGYPAQGYPAAQPYPGQAYPAAQPYPGQAYPAAQPYPDGQYAAAGQPPVAADAAVAAGAPM